MIYKITLSNAAREELIKIMPSIEAKAKEMVDKAKFERRS